MSVFVNVLGFVRESAKDQECVNLDSLLVLGFCNVLHICDRIYKTWHVTRMRKSHNVHF